MRPLPAASRRSTSRGRRRLTQIQGRPEKRRDQLPRPCCKRSYERQRTLKFLLFCNCSAEETKSAKREEDHIPSLLRVLRLFVVPLHFSGFDRVNLRQVSGDADPFLAFVCASPDLAAGRAEINSDGIARVGGHRLSKDCEPCMLGGQPFVQPPPGLSGVAGD